MPIPKPNYRQQRTGNCLNAKITNFQENGQKRELYNDFRQTKEKRETNREMEEEKEREILSERDEIMSRSSATCMLDG